MDEIRICAGYTVHGAPLALLPSGADAVAECVPVYESLPGWRESTVGARTIDALPENARAYLRRIEGSPACRSRWSPRDRTGTTRSCCTTPSSDPGDRSADSRGSACRACT